MLKLHHCDSCGNANIMIVDPDGHKLCPKCHSNFFARTIPASTDFRNRLKPVQGIDFTCHLDLIVAQLMALYIKNGLSVTQCARQLGITRATVYTTLRRNGMLKPPTQADVVLNPHIGDFAQAGGCGVEFKILSVHNPKPKRKKSVTRPAAAAARDLNLPGSGPGPSSNARKE